VKISQNVLGGATFFDSHCRCNTPAASLSLVMMIHHKEDRLDKLSCHPVDCFLVK